MRVKEGLIGAESDVNWNGGVGFANQSRGYSSSIFSSNSALGLKEEARCVHIAFA